MSLEETNLHLPSYDDFVSVTAILELDMSVSEWHGIISAFLCANAVSQGEIYLRALISNQKDEAHQAAKLAMFAVFFVSQQQIKYSDFSFELMLPDDNATLAVRAQALSEWCEGFIRGLSMAGVSQAQLNDEDIKEAFQHLEEFAELDYADLTVDEEDEKALMEVSEYTRMTVMRLYTDLLPNTKENDDSAITH